MIKFGVAGNSNKFFEEGYTSTIQAAEWCAVRGIDIFEYSFGRGVTLPAATATAIGQKFAEFGVELTVHAPYFINFANPDPSMIEKSIGYVTQSIRKCEQFGGTRVVVHPASQGKMTREEAFALTKQNFVALANRLKEQGYEDRFMICIETMGKLGQIGTVDEVIELCGLSECFYPCIDFGHINAREQGILKYAENYNAIILKMLDKLPYKKVENMHIHFSKIAYGPKGELNHLTFEDTKYGPDFTPLAEVLAGYGFSPYIVCESDGTQADDAIEMKRIYNEILAKKAKV